MTKRTTILSGVLLLMLAGAAAAQSKEDVTKLPGYVDFEAMKIFSPEDAAVEILIEPNLIGMIARTTAKSDPDLFQVLSKLKQIRVQTFDMSNVKLDAVEKKVGELTKRLEGQGWQAMVRVRDRKQSEQTYVYIKTQGDLVVGLTVMNVDPDDEAAFVNIVGEIDPEKIGEIGAKFNIDSLDSLETEVREHHKKRKK